MKRICVFCGSSSGSRPDMKPCGVLNVLGYYSPLLAMLDHAVQERFLKPENRALVLARESAAELLRALEEWRPVQVEKWLDRETR